MSEIVDTNNIQYQALRRIQSWGQYNGAYYYSQEIVKNIIPRVKTDRNWNTLGIKGVTNYDHCIVFIHHNVNHDRTYRWLDRYKDQILVCSSPVTYEWALQKGDAIYLPLSIDTEYVKQFATEKTKDACYAGNKWPFKKRDLAHYLPADIDCPPPDSPREDLLRFIAPYKRVYAIGRTALEAKVLGATIEVCDSRYPCSDFWQVLDNQDAAEILQAELNKIDMV